MQSDYEKCLSHLLSSESWSRNKYFHEYEHSCAQKALRVGKMLKMIRSDLENPEEEHRLTLMRDPNGQIHICLEVPKQRYKRHLTIPEKIFTIFKKSTPSLHYSKVVPWEDNPPN